MGAMDGDRIDTGQSLTGFVAVALACEAAITDGRAPPVSRGPTRSRPGGPLISSGANITHRGGAVYVACHSDGPRPCYLWPPALKESQAREGVEENSLFPSARSSVHTRGVSDKGARRIDRHCGYDQLWRYPDTCRDGSKLLLHEPASPAPLGRSGLN
ncbi:hypothetical protein AAFF_G00078680 [Aldrovandia affinis]|uniref:Uncharacterized protein n=1 Tax=Aldrovandia affinis TaxID=143900 RepID=A0AAD7RXJ3_9TELE|nr:hypothetical protein AAFF_G00078680 [Aldrovandia affinis]